MRRWRRCALAATWMAMVAMSGVVWNVSGCSDRDGDQPGAVDGGSEEIQAEGLIVPDGVSDDVLGASDTLGPSEKPCNGPQDCPSGWCVESPAGQVCTPTCFAECAEGWECREVFSASGDPIYICISLLARLCHPCDDDTDCTEAASIGKNRCISHGANGSFCGIYCIGDEKKCPDGYVCDDNAFEDPQCVPISG